MTTMDRKTLEEVCKQRDRAFDALANLVETFWDAHHNHAFDAEDKRDGKDRTCSQGKTLMDCWNGCELFDKDGCKEHTCPMGFNHRKMYKQVLAANDVLTENIAEREHFDLNRIPQYFPDRQYEVSVRWFARMALMLFTEYSFAKQDMTKEKALAFEKALFTLINIGLANFGIVTPPDEIWKLRECKKLEEDEDNEVIKAYSEQVGEKLKDYIARLEDIEKFEVSEIMTCLKNDNKLALAFLIKECMLIMGEFGFGKEYPGADVAVYEGVFSELKYLCVELCGFDRNDKFAMIQNENDTSLDDTGIRIWLPTEVKS